MKEALNICLFGGPGTGKSTASSGLFHEMKKSGKRVEYVTEYAKSLVFSKDFYKISDQTYVLAKQHHPQWKMKEQVDYLIHDGPFVLSCIYYQESPHLPEQEFKDLVVKMYKSYNNVNIFLKRNADEHEYQEYGRNQTIDEAIEIDNEIKQFLIENEISFVEIEVNSNTVSNILNLLEEQSLI